MKRSHCLFFPFINLPELWIKVWWCFPENGCWFMMCECSCCFHDQCLSVLFTNVYDRKSVIDNARRWKKSVCGRWGLGSSGIVLLSEYNHMGMDQYLLIPFLGGYSHPFTSYFDVHQGYKVLTHCHIVLKHCSLASLLHIDHIDSYSRSCGMCSGASTSDTSWGRSWSESQRAWTTNQRATPGVELLCAHSLEGLCFRVAVQVLTRNRKGP